MEFWEFMSFTKTEHKQGRIRVSENVTVFDMMLQFVLSKFYNNGIYDVTVEMIYQELVNEFGADFEKSKPAETIWLPKNI